MAGRSSTLALATLVAGAVGLAGLAWIGARALAGDRAELYAQFAADRMHRLETAALELANDVETIGEDLALASTLVARDAPPGVIERELHAIAAIARPYLAIEVRDGDDAVTARVVAPDARASALDEARAALDQVVAAARARPGALRTSRPVSARDPDLAWYRVFARLSPESGGVVVAVLVDMRPLLTKLRLLSEDSARLLVVGAHGKPAAASDPALADAVRALPEQAAALPNLGRLVASIEARRPGTAMLTEAEASRLGLPRAVAAGVVTPVLIEDGEPWALMLIASTAVLKAQEDLLVRRLLVAALCGVLIIAAISAYVVQNARRAAALKERLAQADRLAHLTEKAEKILDHIPSGVLAMRADRTITAANRWMAERLACDVRGRSLAAAFEGASPAEVDRLDGLIAEALSAGEPRVVRGVSLTPFGADSELSLYAVPLERRLPDLHVLLVVEDDTPVRRLEQRLLHSEKLATAGQLAAGIAHEVATPLNVARGRAEVALAKLGADHPQVPGQRLIIEQIDHVSRLISELLDYVRPRPPAVEAVAAGPALRSAAELLSPEAAKRRVAVRVEVDDRTPPLRADAGQLRQVIVNLAMNALDACAAGGTVVLRAGREPGGGVALEVVDDGVGIPAAQRAQVFDPFFTTKKRGQGTGLGLWVVAQLVRSHAGEIELTSEPGSGTTVRIRWPAATGGAMAA